jgi:hypothetical protein
VSARRDSVYINKTSNSNCLLISLKVTFNLLHSLLCIPFSFGNSVSFYILLRFICGLLLDGSQ